MRARLPITLTLASALAVCTALPAAAVGDSFDWTAGGGGNVQWENSANWAPSAIGDDDTLRFATGTWANNGFPVGKAVRGIVLDAPDFLVSGASIALGTAGITALQDATVNMDIDTSADQTWHAAAGATLELPGWVDVPAGTLAVTGDGTVEFSGRLDGAGVGTVHNAGGNLVLSGQGGAFGGGGLTTTDGITHVSGFLGGSDFLLSGGVLSGGSADPAVGTVRSLTATAGTISPGAVPGGGDLSTLRLWGSLTAEAGSTISITVDGSSSDRIEVQQAVLLNGATLDLNVTTPPAVGEIFQPVISMAQVTGTVTTASGVMDIGEFEDDGHLWRLLGIGQGGMSVEYRGLAPVPPAPQTPPALAATGAQTGWLPLAALGLLAAGALIVLRRRQLS